MNNIISQSLHKPHVEPLKPMTVEEFSVSMEQYRAEFKTAITTINKLDDIRRKLARYGGLNKQIIQEGIGIVPEFATAQFALESYTDTIDPRNFEVALESVDSVRQKTVDFIRSIIEKIVKFAKEVFARVKGYVEQLFEFGESNKAALASTQLLINQAKQKTTESISQEGYSTGSIPIPAPKYLHLEFSKIVSETQRLEFLAQNYIKDTSVLLSVQLRHCKYVIEAYNRLVNSPNPNLAEFEKTCEDVTKDCEGRLGGFRASSRVFDCIEIVEYSEKDQFAGVLKYRVSISNPDKEDLRTSTATYTTNLVKAQELQDRLTALNEEIVKCAARMKDFFSHNSKNFLETLNNLNDSAKRNGKFDCHSKHVMQVHDFLMRGNLIQVVVGLNVLNTVWKAVHGLNRRIVNEFMNS